MTTAQIAEAARLVWIAARDAGNPNHDTIRALASLCADIARDARLSGSEDEADGALVLLDDAERLAGWQ